MNIYSEINQTLQKICQTDDDIFYIAQVKSVQEQTCTVIINNTLELTDVRLSKSKDIFNYNFTNQTVIISYNIFGG